MAVIIAFKFDHFLSSRITAGYPDGTHARLRSRVDHPDPFYVWYHLLNKLRHIYLNTCGCTEGGGVKSSVLYSLHYGRVGVAQQHRAPGGYKINVFIAMCIGKEGSFCLFDRGGDPADGFKCTGWRVDAAPLLKRQKDPCLPMKMAMNILIL